MTERPPVSAMGQRAHTIVATNVVPAQAQSEPGAGPTAAAAQPSATSSPRRPAPAAPGADTPFGPGMWSWLRRRPASLVAGAGLLGALVAALVALLDTPVYEARATLMVKFGREYVYRPELDGISGWQPSRMLELVNNETRILQSRDLHAEVVAALGGEPTARQDAAAWWRQIFDFGPPTLPIDRGLATEQAIDRFEERLSVRPIGDTTVVDLAFEHPDPAYAARALEKLVEHYRARRAVLLAADAGTRAAAEALHRELVAARQELAAYLDKHDAWDLDGRRAELLAEDLTLPLKPVRRPMGGLGSAASIEGGVHLPAGDVTIPSTGAGLRALSQIADGVADRRLAVEAAERAYAFALRRTVEDAASRSLDAAGAANVAVLDSPRAMPAPLGAPAWLRVLVGALLGAGLMTALLVLVAGRPPAGRVVEA